MGFNLFVDEETAEFFIVLMNVYLMGKQNNAFSECTGEEAARYDQMAMNFSKSINKPIHELGWCKDPECDWKEGENE